MSRKSIQINVPAVSAPKEPAKAASRKKTAAGEIVADDTINSWVSQTADKAEALAEPAFSPRPAPEDGVIIQVRLSTQPNWFEAAKIFFFLPQAALWFWWFGMAQRTMRVPPYCRR